MDPRKLRSWWWHKQALDASLAGAPAAEVLAATGWARSVGGSSPYLTLFARAGIGRLAADKAVANLEIYELPSARGCTYVLPASDFSLALKTAQAFYGSEEKLALKLGVTEKELEKLRDGVIKALSRSEMDPDQLRETLGGLVRNLGEAGKKKGLSTTLPVALGRLQVEGEIRRVPTNGRLDQQRYRYALWRFSPRPGPVETELARRYFQWIGPATLAEFQWFSGLGVKAAKAAIEPLKLEALEDGRFLLPADREAFEKCKPAKDAQYALVSSIDGLGLLRRDLKSLLDPADSARASTPDWESHAILDRGRWIGSWEYDPDSESIAWAVWVKKNKDMEAAVQRTEKMIRTEMGDARSFSLDSPKSRAPRIAALRKGI